MSRRGGPDVGRLEFLERIYERANIDIAPGNGITSPMPLLTPEQRRRVAEARAEEEFFGMLRHWRDDL